MTAIDRAEEALGALEASVASGTFRADAQTYSRFADVKLIAGDRGAGAAPAAGAREVVTPYAALLGTLFVRLRDAFMGLIDHVSKDEFYARLGHVANDWHSRTLLGADSAELLRWVLQEARVILREIERGEFDGFLVAPGEMAVADVLRRLERGETLNEDEMAAYEAFMRSRPG